METTGDFLKRPRPRPSHSDGSDGGSRGRDRDGGGSRSRGDGGGGVEGGGGSGVGDSAPPVGEEHGRMPGRGPVVASERARVEARARGARAVAAAALESGSDDGSGSGADEAFVGAVGSSGSMEGGLPMAVLSPEDLAVVERPWSLRVWAVTWNMHGKATPDEALLRELLAPSAGSDVIVVATQECEQSIGRSFFTSSKERWESGVLAALGDAYVRVGSRTLMAVHLVVYVTRSLERWVSDVQTEYVATGIGNLIGNKGGVAVSMTLRDSTSLLFVGAHLAAHQDMVEERNANYHRINECLTLVPTTFRRWLTSARAPGSPIAGLEDRTLDEHRYNIFERFDHVIWMGDLNYRINGNRDMVSSLIHDRALDVLRANDQLQIARSRGDAFVELDEAKISFLPTYKFDKGSPFYDTSPKQRIPAWTDRILHKPHPDLVQTHYDAIPDILYSDHRPVWAAYLMCVPPGDTIPEDASRSQQYIDGDRVEEIARAQIATGTSDDYDNEACIVQ